MIYILMGWSGGYDDYYSYPMKAFSSRTSANDALEEIETKCDNLIKLNDYGQSHYGKYYKNVDENDHKNQYFGFRIVEVPIQ